MLPFVIAGAVGLGALVLGGCGEEKDKESQEELDTGPIKLPFYQTPSNKLWFDSNADGKEIAQELVNFPEGASAEVLLRTAKKFIQERPYFQPPCNSEWEVEILPKARWESPQGQAKKRLMTRQINKDIDKIKEIPRAQRPPWMKQLLEDLILIQQELPYLKFELAKVAPKGAKKLKSGEVPYGFLATYNDETGEILYTVKDPHSIMVHELDHAVTARVRVEDWAIANKIKCPDGTIFQFPMTPYRQTHDQVRTSFEFYINLENEKDETLTFDTWHEYFPLIYALEHGREKCLNKKEKESRLADEVHAYLVMVRYLLFEMMTHPEVKLTQDQITAAGKGNSMAKNRIKLGLAKVLQDSSLNPEWAQDLVLNALEDTYAGKNGALKEYVLKYYTNQGQYGFVDVPGCVEE